MKVSSIQILALSALATAVSTLATAPAQAQRRNFDFRSARATQRAERANDQRMTRAREAARRPTANTSVCVLDPDTGAGTSVLKVPGIVSVTLVNGMPDRFGLVGEEICGDLRDNDCDGLVDENCKDTEDKCGDGIIDDTEECDDGNQDNNDECKNDCTIGDPGPPQCGDGIIHPTEECDDGNQDNNDECKNDCTFGGGPLCGDGIVQEGEECDDGNQDDNDNCTNECILGDGGTGPRPEYWQAGYECEDCMESECTQEAQACIDDPGCEAPRNCITQERCLDPFTASLSCLCGSLTISQCQNATSFPGACAEELIESVNSSDIRRFDNWLTPTTSAGRANRAFVCMGRKCKSQCSSLFDAPNAPTCGNGRRDANEECDDGNTQSGDGCSADCNVEPPTCGDGDINQDDEQCDDGNRVDDDACSNDCKINPGPSRGDWLAGPQCDRCMQNRCEPESSGCLKDPGCRGIGSCVGEAMCMSPQSGATSCLCGSLSTAECLRTGSFQGACADEFILGLRGDELRFVLSHWIYPKNPTARAHAAYTCMTRLCQEQCSSLFEAKPLPPKCGDGKINQHNEECDDGNTQSGDGCSADCIIEIPNSEEGYWLAGPQCDACMDTRCAIEAKICKNDPTGCDPARVCMGQSNCSDEDLGPLSCLCGEGVSPNECATGDEALGICAPYMIEEESRGNPKRAIARINNPANPASSASRAFLCMARSCPTECSNNFGGEPARPCGNGIVNDNEECDDGNALSGDGCSARCEIEACGNNRRDAGEECDDGNTQSKDGCSAECKLEDPVCGNGIVEGDEECDDTNTVNGDGCTADCRVEIDEQKPLFGTPTCNRCMAQQCADRTRACKTTQGCRASTGCVLKNKCLSRKIGPLSCLCGEGTSVASCTTTPLADLQGECAAEMIKGLGLGDSTTVELFRNFIRVDTPTGLANNMFVCMARKCADDCSESFRPAR